MPFHGESPLSCQYLAEEYCLVETALSKSLRVKRDRHDQFRPHVCYEPVQMPGRKEAKGSGELDPVFVLEAMNQLSGMSLVQKRRPRRNKGWRQGRAGTAAMVVSSQGPEGDPADSAAWRIHRREGFSARIADMDFAVICNTGLAEMTERGEDAGKKSLEKHCATCHCSLLP
jgi:hypothetical protein